MDELIKNIWCIYILECVFTVAKKNVLIQPGWNVQILSKIIHCEKDQWELERWHLLMQGAQILFSKSTWQLIKNL